MVCCLLAVVVYAQDVQQLRETARSFQRQGDYENAILVLNKAISKEPDNPDLKKDLAITYYVSRQYPKALSIIKPRLDRPDADEQVFQMAALIYRTDENFKEADRIYKLGLKKFPQSGLMYSEYGDMLELKDPGQGNGIKQWEKGIESDPEYSGNYYHATKYYSNLGNPIWVLLYGEIFVNLESYTGRTTEIKNVLLDAYKKMYVNDLVANKGKTPFETELLTAFNRQKSLAGNGITAESLTAIRARFILDWFAGDGKKYPFRLFEMERQLLQEGLFESYNQWLFGSAENMPAYQNWTSTHAAEYANFTKFQQNRLFKVPAGQYYNK
jgi:tetratricopeptide (TPR) repeat protein